MADDGMLLNFEVGDAPLKRQVRVTGGKWRERKRVRETLKRGHQDATPPGADRRILSRSKAAPSRDEHPAKRQRTDAGPKPEITASQNEKTRALTFKTGKLPPGSISTAPKAPGQVTSRLFTSNPVPKTVFGDLPAKDEYAQPEKPSNAPLSEEAASFHALGLSGRIAQHLSSKLEMKAPTAIQKNSIPQLVKEDSDAFLQAETGSGKTLAYLLPIVQRIMALSFNADGSSRGAKIHRHSGIFAVILAPTRELGKQIFTVLEKLLRCAPWIVSTAVLGGENKHSEKARIRKGVNILVATPGRLVDHLDHTKVLDLGTVRWLVLDEGDRLMEMGFEEELRSIVAKIRKEALAQKNKDGVVLDSLPQRRVTVLCSATMKMNVQKLGEISLEDAVHITAVKPGAEKEEESTEVKEAIFAAPSQLKQSYIVTPAKLRLVTLISYLKDAFARRGSVMKAIIFISCADSVDFHFDLLKTSTPEKLKPEGPKPSHTATTLAPAAYVSSPANPEITVLRLHGSLPQPVRTATLQAFTGSRNPVILITTDISSRGLDVPAVDLVIEYDPAFTAADHVHRIGRTARAGRPGKAVLFLQPGCEEGYISHLGGTGTITPQLYDAVLQKGLATPVTYPPSLSSSFDKNDSNDSDEPVEGGRATWKKETWSTRAETLQLHLEQRLLAPSNAVLLDAARQAFRSHIRAYATHVREERDCFDITQLHWGHTAKAFCLRETPGGIGGGVSRRTGVHHKASATAAGGKGGGTNGGKRTRGGDDDLGDGILRGRGGADAANDEDTARRMREKMKAVMDAASEFHIG